MSTETDRIYQQKEKIKGNKNDVHARCEKDQN